MNNTVGLPLAIAEKKFQKEYISKARDAPEDLSHVEAMFLANMSHEFRTPLNAIIGISSLLQLEESLNPEQKEMIDIIRNSGEDLLILVEKILDFTMIEAGNIRLEASPFNLYNRIESAFSMFSSAASAKGLNLFCSIDEGTPAVVIGDSKRLGQILKNLLENAIKFTERGRVMIRVSSDINDLIHFQIMDTGIGIPNEERKCLFKAFRQVDDSLTRKYPGIGLGLATSRRLVELMGGQIWVESSEDDGSAFHFTFKAKRVSRQHTW